MVHVVEAEPALRRSPVRAWERSAFEVVERRIVSDRSFSRDNWKCPLRAVQVSKVIHECNETP